MMNPDELGRLPAAQSDVRLLGEALIELEGLVLDAVALHLDLDQVEAAERPKLRQLQARLAALGEAPASVQRILANIAKSRSDAINGSALEAHQMTGPRATAEDQSFLDALAQQGGHGRRPT